MSFGTFSAVILQLGTIGVVGFMFITNNSFAQTKCPPFQPKTQQEARTIEQSANKNVCWGRDPNGNLVYTSAAGPNVYRPLAPVLPKESSFTSEPPSPLDPTWASKPATFEGSWILIMESFSQSHPQDPPTMISFAGRIDLVPDLVSKGYKWKALPDCSDSSGDTGLDVAADGTVKAGDVTMKIVKVNGTHLTSRFNLPNSDGMRIYHFVRVAKGDTTAVQIARATPSYFIVTFTDATGRNYTEDLNASASNNACKVYVLPGNYRFLYGDILVPGTFTQSISIHSGSTETLSLPPFKRR
jgi:hypothetical protein